MKLRDQLVPILFPTHCVICHRLPRSICDECWQAVSFGLRIVTRGSLTGYSITDYASGSATILNAFKEQGHRRFGELLAVELAERLTKPAVDVIIPAPSSKRNFRKRGFTPAEVIAKQLANRWQLPVEKLSLIGSPADQSGLVRGQRITNLVGSMVARRPLLGKRVLLVDDIVTTGATLTEMARAASAAGAVVTGFVTVAETIPKTLTKN